MELLFICLTIIIALASAASLAGLLDLAPNATYDYVVVGCGIAGLVVTMRLSELSDVTVLCIEAGPLDHYEDIIMWPIDIGRDMGGIWDWNISTVPQPQLDGNTRTVPMGRVVGGGSILNGMLWNRGNQEDYNDWANFGNPGWGWSGLLPYFKKSETYTPRYYNVCETQPVQFVAEDHGFSGPVNVSYPEYYWNQSNNWFEALNSLGVPTVFDPNDGTGAGALFIPSDVDPVNQTRADARRSYYDPYCQRSNFNFAINSQVTRILFNNSAALTAGNSTVQNYFEYGAAKVKRQAASLTANGVEYASNAASPRQTVYARQEVIVAAGALHSPQLLQLSGIGPSALLQQNNINVLQDLVGVGRNFQDHCMLHVDYSYQAPGLLTPYSFQSNASYNDASETQYLTSRTGPWTGEPSTAIAFLSLPQISNLTTALLASAANSTLNTTTDPALLAGYQTQLSSLLPRLASPSTPIFENLNNNAGGLDVALMHPLSRGTVQITNSDPFTAPAIDPRWLSNPLDTAVLVAALQFKQLILDTPPIQALQPSYKNFPQNPNTTVLETLLRQGLKTEYHYSGTCAMLPLDLGGVVGPDLVVHGTANLRVVDTSIFPMIPSAHLQAVAYAVAEKAADLIKGVDTAPASSATAAPTSTGQNESPSYMDWLLNTLGWNMTGAGT